MDEKKYPDECDISFVVADDIRSESDGSRLTIVGAYPSRTLPIPRPPEGNGAMGAVPSVVAGFFFSNLSGEFSVSVEVKDPSGKSLLPGIPDRTAKIARATDALVLLFPFKPFVYQFGAYLFTVKVDGKSYTRVFNVVEAHEPVASTSE